MSAFAHHESDVLHAVFSPDSSKVATASYDNTACVWNVATGQLAIPPLKHDEEVVYVAFSHDGRLIATASSGIKTARIWDAATGRPVSPPLKHRQWVYQAIFNGDGRFLLTTSGVGRVGSLVEYRLWDAATGELAAPPFAYEDNSLSLENAAAFSADSRRILMTGLGAAYVWSLPSIDLPVEDLLLWAQVISGHAMGAGEGVVPLEAESNT